jgi:hypothetical protein
VPVLPLAVEVPPSLPGAVLPLLDDVPLEPASSLWIPSVVVLVWHCKPTATDSVEMIAAIPRR